MKAHRATPAPGLNFLFVESPNATDGANPAIPGLPDGMASLFQDEFLKQTKSLLASKAGATVASAELSAGADAPTEQVSDQPMKGAELAFAALAAQSALQGEIPGGNPTGQQAAMPSAWPTGGSVVPLSERVGLWLGPSGKSALNIDSRGLRTFGRDQGLSEAALDALLGRPEAAGVGMTSDISHDAGASLNFQVAGFSGAAKDWLEGQWQLRGAGPDYATGMSSPFGPGDGSGDGPGKIKIKITELLEGLASKELSSSGRHARTEDWLQARQQFQLPGSAGDSAGTPTDSAADGSGRPVSPAASQASGPIGSQGSAGGALMLDADMSGSGGSSTGQQATSDGSGQSSGQGAAGGQSQMLTGQELSDRFGELVGRRILQQIQSGNWKVDIELHPSDLGSIQVEMTWQDGQLDTVMHASEDHTRELMEQSLAKLRETLSGAGTNLASVAMGEGQRRHGRGQPDKRPDGYREMKEDSSRMGVETAPTPVASPSGLDVLV